MSVVNYKNDNKYKIGDKVIIKQLDYDPTLQNAVSTGFVDYMEVGGRVEKIVEISFRHNMQGQYKTFRLTDGIWYLSWQLDPTGIQEIEI